MKLSDGAEAVYKICESMEIDVLEMADLELIMATMKVMEKKK